MTHTCSANGGSYYCAYCGKDMNTFDQKQRSNTMSTTMRAKLQVGFVQEHYDWQDKTKKTSETLTMHGVAKKDGYPPDGLDDDNTFARWSPQADFRITINNPTLWEKFKVGDKFYVDFTQAEA